MASKYFHILLLFWLMVGSEMLAQGDQYISEYLVRLENSRNYLIEVASLMPEENYEFKATEESLTFSENLLHIGFAMNWHSKTLLGGIDTPNWQADTLYKVENKSKEEMIALIDKTFSQSIELIGNMDPQQLNEQIEYFGHERSKRQILMLLSDHITHHRGQMLVYLRLNGVVPPRYVLYQ